MHRHAGLCQEHLMHTQSLMPLALAVAARCLVCLELEGQDLYVRTYVRMILFYSLGTIWPPDRVLYVKA